jgi:hypothetical protein
MLNITRIIVDGAILSVLASLFIIVTLRLNPRIWLQDYPKDVQAKVLPKTPQEKHLSLVLGIPFLLLLVAIPFVSSLTMKYQTQGQIPFWVLFINSFSVAFIFNLVDWLILDWLMFCTITPGFLVITGTEGMAGYKDYLFHFRGFLIGSVLSAIAGLVIATIVLFL